jgi:hypothetical protein
MIGLKELVLLALVVLALYGRSGVLKSRQFRTIWPWISPMRRPVARTAGSRAAGLAQALAGAARESTRPSDRSKKRLFSLEGNRLFWFVTILAASAVAAWIVTKVMIMSGAAAQPSHY